MQCVIVKCQLVLDNQAAGSFSSFQAEFCQARKVAIETIISPHYKNQFYNRFYSPAKCDKGKNSTLPCSEQNSK
jgi:hypothetical protein